MNNKESNYMGELHTNLNNCFQFTTISSLFILTMSKHSKIWTILYLILTMFGWLCLAEEEVIFSLDYSKHEMPPTEDGKPLKITSSMNLRNILEVKEKEQIISLETTLRFYWKVEN